MKTCRVDSASLRPGVCIVGRSAGQGVLGRDVPDTGVHGVPLLRNDLSLPEDADVEVRAEIVATTFPSGTVDIDEFGGIGTSGAPNGLHYVLYRLWVNGVASGVDIGFGPGVARALIAIGADHRPTLPAPLNMRGNGARVATAGRVTPVMWPTLDLSETDDVRFAFPAQAPTDAAGAADVLATVDVTVEARQGADAGAAAMLVGLPMVGRDFALQRVRAGAPGVTYLLRAEATFAPSGRRALAVAYLPVRRLA